MKTFRAAPKAATLIESLRDIGYSLETAVADIIDNSITAGATIVKLFATAPGPDAKIGILDNGRGMSEKELLDAMRLGSRNPLEERAGSDLGRFGLGLKTASFSQCRRLTVVSRQSEDTITAIWDLDSVARFDDWLVQLPESADDVPWIEELGSSGTLIVWEKLDRVVDPHSDDGALPQLIADVSDHLELVFHRFLSRRRGRKKLRIMVNGRALEALDPFHSAHPATIAGPLEHIGIGKDRVTVQPFTLPHHNKVSPADWNRYGLRGGYLKNQGFYVYREHRLIIHGTWFQLARQMELTKLARVCIDISNSSDSDWKIDVKKASARPPYYVKQRLRKIVDTMGAPSKRVFTKKGSALVDNNSLPVWNRVQFNNQIIYRLNREHPVITGFVDKLQPDAVADFFEVLDLASAALPMNALYADMAASPDSVAGDTLRESELISIVSASVAGLLSAGVNPDQVSEMLRHAEPFRSRWQTVEDILVDLLKSEESYV